MDKIYILDIIKSFFKRLGILILWVLAFAAIIAAVLYTITNPWFLFVIFGIAALVIIIAYSIEDANNRKEMRESAWEARMEALEDYTTYANAVDELTKNLDCIDLHPDARKQMENELSHAIKCRDYHHKQVISHEKTYMKYGGEL